MRWASTTCWATWPSGSPARTRAGGPSCAAEDCLTSSERVELVAIGDLFPDRVTECRANLARMATEDTSGGLKTKIKLDDAHAFSGFDAYQKVIGSKVDVVLLATPPAFRARHLAAAI